jgi:hypothetical protein
VKKSEISNKKGRKKKTSDESKASIITPHPIGAKKRQIIESSLGMILTRELVLQSLNDVMGNQEGMIERKSIGKIPILFSYSASEK